MVWAKPAKPTGVLFAAHGCGHAATDWFPKGPDCAGCTGLPEELNITAAALARGLALVAMTSADRDSGCWAVDPGSNDIAAVRAPHAAGLGHCCPRPNCLPACQAAQGAPYVLTAPRRSRRQAKAVFAKLLPREGLGGLPLYAFGASSGGAFVLALGAEAPLAGVIRRGTPRRAAPACAPACCPARWPRRPGG